MSTRSRIEKTCIRKLIELKKFLSDQDMADILLVWDGFKPAAIVELSYFPRSKFSREEFHRKIGNLKKILQKLDLHYRLQVNYSKRKREVAHYSYIARNQKKLEEVIVADAEMNTKKRRLQIGVLLGYPKTAAEAFANGKTLNYRNLPSAVSQKKELKFLNFRLSRHWRRELEYMRKRARAIKQITPDLYMKIIKGSKKIGQFKDVSGSSS